MSVIKVILPIKLPRLLSAQAGFEPASLVPGLYNKNFDKSLTLEKIVTKPIVKEYTKKYFDKVRDNLEFVSARDEFIQALKEYYLALEKYEISLS